MLPLVSAPRRSPEMRRITLLLASLSLSLTVALAGAATIPPAPSPASPAPTDAKLLFEHGCLRQAGAACEQRLATNPADAGAGALLARVRAEQGDLDRSEEHTSELQSHSFFPYR